MNKKKTKVYPNIRNLKKTPIPLTGITTFARGLKILSSAIKFSMV